MVTFITFANKHFMCLSIPGEIKKIDNEMAEVSIGGTLLKVGLQLIDDPKVGDYVLVHSGIALQKIDEEEAKETIRIIESLNDPEVK
jgi:hydrogenase expression/formation protein HypC